MEFNNIKLKNPAELQDNSSITFKAVNNNDPIVIQITFSGEQMSSLQRQSGPASPNITPRGMPRTVASLYVGCSPRMFDNMVNAGEMPKPRMIGTKKIWDRYDLDGFFENQLNEDESGSDWDER